MSDFAAQAEAFLDYQEKNRRMSAHSVLAYRSDLNQFGHYLMFQGSPDLKDIDVHYIRGWMAELLDAGMAVRTVHRKVSTVRSFFRWLRKQGMLNSDPLARLVMPKTAKKIVRDIPAADLAAMFRSFPWEEQEFGYRDRLILLALYTTGMRLSELTGLSAGDIDLKRNTLTVTGKRNKQRVIPLHPELAEALQAHLSQQSGACLISSNSGKPAYPMMIYRIVNKYLKLFSSALKTSPHVLRHSFATHMLNNGASLMAIKDLLGHASLSATQVYTRNSFEKLRAVHKLHPRK